MAPPKRRKYIPHQFSNSQQEPHQSGHPSLREINHSCIPPGVGAWLDSTYPNISLPQREEIISLLNSLIDGRE